MILLEMKHKPQRRIKISKKRKLKKKKFLTKGLYCDEICYRRCTSNKTTSAIEFVQETRMQENFVHPNLAYVLNKKALRNFQKELNPKSQNNLGLLNILILDDFMKV
jgi:hypothetical protein